MPRARVVLPVSDLVRVVAATHLSSYVESPFADRGGLFLIGPPESLKSTIISVLDQHYGDARCISDVNVQTLMQLRDSIAAGHIRTLGLPEYAKIYERHSQTAENIEGTLRAMVAEGFATPSFEDQRINTLKARVTIIGAVTPAVQRKRFAQWEDSGFARRFLWSLIHLADPRMLVDAVVEWTRVEFGVPVLPRAPLTATAAIPNLTTREERREMAHLLKDQPGGGHAMQLQLLTKILAVLRWWQGQVGFGNRRGSTAFDTVSRFARSLGREGVEVEFTAPTQRRVGRRKTQS